MSEPEPTPEPPSESAFVTAAVVFYAVMGLLGLGWMSWLGVDVGLTVWGPGDTVLRDVLIGAGAGLPVVGLSYALRNWEPMRALSEELGSQMNIRHSWAIAVLALTSSVGEELLFRGGMQAWVGFWPTVLIFGALHGGFAGRLRVWSVFATLAGLLLGYLFVLTDNLVAPILCHFTVNFFNLHQLIQEPTTPT